VLALVLDAGAKKDEARALFTLVLAPGVTLPEELEADARHRLGAQLQERGDAAAARPHLERALALKRAWLGADHADCVDLARRLSSER
jgi:hypothetical protein